MKRGSSFHSLVGHVPPYHVPLFIDVAIRAVLPRYPRQPVPKVLRVTKGRRYDPRAAGIYVAPLAVYADCCKPFMKLTPVFIYWRMDELPTLI